MTWTDLLLPKRLVLTSTTTSLPQRYVALFIKLSPLAKYQSDNSVDLSSSVVSSYPFEMVKLLYL